MKLLSIPETTKITGSKICACAIRTFYYMYDCDKYEFTSAAGINNFLKQATASANDKITSTSKEISEDACKARCCDSQQAKHNHWYGTKTLTMYKYGNDIDKFTLFKHCN